MCRQCCNASSRRLAYCDMSKRPSGVGASCRNGQYSTICSWWRAIARCTPDQFFTVPTDFLTPVKKPQTSEIRTHRMAVIIIDDRKVTK